jgi:hypothetical protein
MGALRWVPGVPHVSWLLLVPIGAVVYVASLALVGGFRQEDMDLLHELLPRGRLGRQREGDEG